MIALAGPANQSAPPLDCCGQNRETTRRKQTKAKTGVCGGKRRSWRSNAQGHLQHAHAAHSHATHAAHSTHATHPTHPSSVARGSGARPASAGTVAITPRVDIRVRS